MTVPITKGVSLPYYAIQSLHKQWAPVVSRLDLSDLEVQRGPTPSSQTASVGRGAMDLEPFSEAPKWERGYELSDGPSARLQGRTKAEAVLWAVSVQPHPHSFQAVPLRWTLPLLANVSGAPLG